MERSRLAADTGFRQERHRHHQRAMRAKNGDVVGLKKVTETSEIILVTDTGRTIRFNAKDMPIQKRGGLGVKLMDLAVTKRISAVALVGDDNAQPREDEPELRNDDAPQTDDNMPE